MLFRKKNEQETYKAMGVMLTSDVWTATLGARRWWCLPLRTKGGIFPSRVLYPEKTLIKWPSKIFYYQVPLLRKQSKYVELQNGTADQKKTPNKQTNKRTEQKPKWVEKNMESRKWGTICRRAKGISRMLVKWGPSPRQAEQSRLD